MRTSAVRMGRWGWTPVVAGLGVLGIVTTAVAESGRVPERPARPGAVDVGLEMEGSYYLQQILKSRNRGGIPQDVSLRFLYYVSDLPLGNDSDLSNHLRASEGVPPLYGITREVLSCILEGGGD